MKPNPFHVLGLPVSADDEEVAERFRELAVLGEQEAGALAEWAKDELMGRPETRELHALLEVPGADYRGERWEDFVRQYGRRPAASAGQSPGEVTPRAADFDLAAVARLLLLDRPLEVRDVLFG